MSADDAWALVGDNLLTRYILRWDGSTWAPRVLPLDEPALLRLAASRPSDVWLAGGQVIRRLVKGLFVDVPRTGLPRRFVVQDVAASPAGAVLVGLVGLRLHLARWDGQGWRVEVLPQSPRGERPFVELTLVGGSSRLLVFGSSSSSDMNVGTSYAVMQRGDGWTRIAGSAAEPGVFTAAAARAPNDIWVVSWAGEGSRVLHWDGRRWSRTDPLHDHPEVELLALAAGRRGLLAVGRTTGNCLEKCPIGIRYDGAWSRLAIPARLRRQDPNGMRGATLDSVAQIPGTSAVWVGGSWGGVEDFAIYDRAFLARLDTSR